ncbi:ABC transporter ATP-binding protein [Nitrosococcus wardiae]|uniref:ATP-binding cassette domain-containing protein n=1 Tax=Nitrosococcus wardiae TaxID=1814290 RepID=A0A4P7BZ64_9GAMM|nr:polysaccharide ABC transporter ATP-binding protein [Nitrosococcus wardiae]QBQ54490.1 ATP-binding cassette domain-containing protein [Nitrosococcus wardiae]
MSDTLIKVDDLSKKFCRSLKRSLWYGLQDLGNELRGQRHGGNGELRPEEFWAARDINFELNRGECLGLIGHNGAGKTTLLRMLNGLIKPDQGRIEMRGQVGALIALGAGFNPILTGRENIYVNASVLGLSKRHVDAKLEEIIDFAEIGEFIDTPVRNYSSGMNVRLGFAVAAVLIEPDILFLDEVLAVGDIGFVIKCLNTVRRLTENAAVVFVSHNMQYISSFCTRVMVMEHGSTLLDSPNPAEGIDHYYALVKHEVQTSGTGEALVLGLDLLVDGETLTGEEPSIPQGSSVTAMLRVRVDGPRRGAHVSLFIHDETMAPVVCTPIYDADSRMLCLSPGEHHLEIPLGIIDLNAGKYSFVVAIRDVKTSISLARVQGLRSFRVFSERTHWGKIVRPAIPQSEIVTCKQAAVTRRC